MLRQFGSWKQVYWPYTGMIIFTRLKQRTGSEYWINKKIWPKMGKIFFILYFEEHIILITLILCMQLSCEYVHMYTTYLYMLCSHVHYIPSVIQLIKKRAQNCKNSLWWKYTKKFLIGSIYCVISWLPRNPLFQEGRLISK